MKLQEAAKQLSEDLRIRLRHLEEEIQRWQLTKQGARKRDH